MRCAGWLLFVAASCSDVNTVQLGAVAQAGAESVDAGARLPPSSVEGAGSIDHVAVPESTVLDASAALDSGSVTRSSEPVDAGTDSGRGDDAGDDDSDDDDDIDEDDADDRDDDADAQPTLDAGAPTI